MIRRRRRRRQDEQAHAAANPDTQPQRAFFELLEQGDVDDAEALLDAHALDVDARREEAGPTALHIAAASGDAAAVHMLLQHGADKTLRFSGMIPADVARSMGFTDAVALLAQ